MATVDELTNLRRVACQAYWVCESAQNIILGTDVELLASKLPMVVDRLKGCQQQLGDQCKTALSTIEEAAAIERLPAILIGDREAATATAEAMPLIFRLCLRCSPGTALEVREAVAAMPPVNYDAATKRVREEWNAAVRMLNGVTPVSISPAAIDEHTDDTFGDRRDDDPQPRVTADKRMKAELAANLDAVVGLSLRAWSKRTGIPKSTIADCKTWKELVLLREKAKAERAMDRRRRAKPR